MTIFLVTSIILLLIEVPISISVGVNAVLECLVLDYPLMVTGQEMITGVDFHLLIAIPLFIPAGDLMNAGKITDKIFSLAKELVDWTSDGLGHANIVTSIIPTDMSGNTVADTDGLGAIKMETITRNEYRDNFSGTVTAASSVIGPIFPPSIPLIIYGATASVSMAELFMGGVLPGFLIGVTLTALVFIFMVKYRLERHSFDIVALSKQFFDSILSPIIPLITLAGFASESFTPMEAFSIIVAYSLVIAVVVYHTIDWKAFKNCLLESAITSVNALFIIETPMLFAYILVKGGASKVIADFTLGISGNPEVVLLIINVVLLILGMLMEPGVILTLMLPILLSTVKDLNTDLVHFGAAVVLNLIIGQVTPSFDVCLSVISNIAKTKLDKLYRLIIPFLVPLIIVLLMYTYIPDIVI